MIDYGLEFVLLVPVDNVRWRCHKVWTMLQRFFVGSQKRRMKHIVALHPFWQAQLVCEGPEYLLDFEGSLAFGGKLLERVPCFKIACLEPDGLSFPERGK